MKCRYSPSVPKGGRVVALNRRHGSDRECRGRKALRECNESASPLSSQTAEAGFVASLGRLCADVRFGSKADKPSRSEAIPSRLRAIG